MTQPPLENRISKKSAWIIWIVVVILSAAAIIIGNRIVSQDLTLFSDYGAGNYKATVLTIEQSTAEDRYIDGLDHVSNQLIYFTAEIKAGPYKGQIVTAEQSLDELYASTQYTDVVAPGDNVLLYMHEDYHQEESYEEEMDAQLQTTPSPNSHEDTYSWYFADYYRFDKIVALALVFAVLVIAIGRGKGVNTLLSLSFTFLFVFMVFVPAVMGGKNAYLAAIITCLYTIIMTLLLVSGPQKKTLATIIGCISGTVIAAIGTAIMKNLLRLTGFTDEESIYLSMLNPEAPIDHTAVIFAAILIGAMGAIMDVAMDLSSSLYELRQHAPEITFRELFRSGMRIGRDIMGTMANTLVLAYIGSSLSSIMLLLTYSTSPMHLLNRELIIVECLQALIGSLAILLTIPLTVLVCGLLYLPKGKSSRRLTPTTPVETLR